MINLEPGETLCWNWYLVDQGGNDGELHPQPWWTLDENMDRAA